jgi:hypothetical protein
MQPMGVVMAHMVRRHATCWAVRCSRCTRCLGCPNV